jgi:hypothetical protein
MLNALISALKNNLKYTMQLNLELFLKMFHSKNKEEKLTISIQHSLKIHVLATHSSIFQMLKFQL